MKKLLLICALSIACSTIASTNANRPQPTRQEIQMGEATLPAPTIRPRSVMPYTQAWVDYNKQAIDVNINYYLGQLEISIADAAGNVVYSQSVDSDVVASAQLPMPDAGDYRITIRGEEYLAEGDFMIE